MTVYVQMEGCNEEVEQFLAAVKTLVKWQMFRGSQQKLSDKELRVECYAHEVVDKQNKPTISNRSISKLQLTSNGKPLEIVLLDAEVVEMGEGITIIHGKNYDIFA